MDVAWSALSLSLQVAGWATALNLVFGIGVGYRNGDAVTFLMKVSFMKFFQLGYSYDVTTSKLRVASSNTHEVILGITPCGRQDMSRRMINCPAFD